MPSVAPVLHDQSLGAVAQGIHYFGRNLCLQLVDCGTRAHGIVVFQCQLTELMAERHGRIALINSAPGVRGIVRRQRRIPIPITMNFISNNPLLKVENIRLDLCLARRVCR